MRRFFPFLLIISIAGIIILGILPGCDELVTNEYYSYDTITLWDSTCVAFCHSDVNTTKEVAVRRWRNSGHALSDLVDTTIMGRNTLSCGPQCHTREGFVQFLTQASISLDNYPTEIGCFACHQPHTTWDFSLRSEASVDLIGGANYNNGKSNICVQCHRSFIDMAGMIYDSVIIDTSTYDAWDSLMFHGMGEADLLLGYGGFEFDGVSWSWTSSHSHRTAANRKCIACHQEKSNGFTLGGHSLNIVYGSEALVEACNISNCHAATPLTPESIEAKQKLVKDRLYDLKVKLSKMGFLNLDTGLPESTLVIPDSNVAGAIYNYYYILNDKSKGMHDFVYDTLLLRSSLDYLGGDIPPPKR